MALETSVEKLFASWQNGDFDTVASILQNADTQSDALNGAVGTPGLVSLFSAVRDAFGPPEITLAKMIAGDQTVAAEFWIEGKHGKDLNYPPVTVPAAGRPLLMTGYLVVEGKEDEIVSARLYWNWMACLAQLGVRPHMRADLPPQ
jgi:hypothetical protein